MSGDGKSDLAVANVFSNTVSALLGNGDGTFGAKVDYGTGLAPISVAIGDVSGDGKRDLVTANQGSNTVSVLLNTGPAPITHVPVITAPPGLSVDEGMALTSAVSATDADGDHVTLSMLPDAPTGATFVDNGDNTGTFNWTPDFSQGDPPPSHAYSVTFQGTDGIGGVGTATTAITVNNVNRAPVANPGGPYSGTVGYAVSFDGSHRPILTAMR